MSKPIYQKITSYLWVADDGVSYWQGQTIGEFMIELDYKSWTGFSFTNLGFYIEPFAVVFEAYEDRYGEKREVNTNAEWNEYDLMTYSETTSNYSGTSSLQRMEFTYEK